MDDVLDAMFARMIEDLRTVRCKLKMPYIIAVSRKKRIKSLRAQIHFVCTMVFRYFLSSQGNEFLNTALLTAYGRNADQLARILENNREITFFNLTLSYCPPGWKGITNVPYKFCFDAQSSYRCDSVH